MFENFFYISLFEILYESKLYESIDHCDKTILYKRKVNLNNYSLSSPNIDSCETFNKNLIFFFVFIY